MIALLSTFEPFGLIHTGLTGVWADLAQSLWLAAGLRGLAWCRRELVRP